MSTHNLGIVYQNDIAHIEEFEVERKPYGCSSCYVVTHKNLPSIRRSFDEHEIGNIAKQKAIEWCDKYIKDIKK